MTTTEPLMTSVEHRYGVTVLAVGGEIDMVTAPRLEKAIDDVLADDPPALVIDLTEGDASSVSGSTTSCDSQRAVRSCDSQQAVRRVRWVRGGSRSASDNQAD